MRFALDKKLSKDVVKLAAPVVLAMLFQTSVNLADTMMIGWMPDESVSVAGVAAIGITLPLFWAVGGFLSAIAVGTQALAARRFGEKKHTRSGEVLFNSLMVSFTAGTLFSIVGALLIPYIFPFFNSDPEVVRLGVPYAQFRFIGVLSMVASFSYKSFFDGIGKTYIHMVASVVMNLTNIFLDAVLIFGLWGFPKLGVLGAGIGTMVASYIGFFIMIAWSFLPEYRNKFKYYRKSNLNLGVTKEIVRLSLPGGLATVFVASGFLLFLKIVGIIDQTEWLATFPREAAAALGAQAGLGLQAANGAHLMGMIQEILPRIDHFTESTRMPVYSAGTKVIFDLMSITFVSAMAIGTATATLVSQNLGKGNPRMAERYTWEAVKVGAYFFGFLGLCEVIAPQLFLHLFTNKQAVIEAATASLRIIGLVNFMIVAGLVFMQALFGAGNAKFVMYTEMSLHFLCLVPLAYIFGVVLDMKLEGVWLAGAIYIISLASVLGWKFWQGKWKYIKI